MIAFLKWIGRSRIAVVVGIVVLLAITIGHRFGPVVAPPPVLASAVSPNGRYEFRFECPRGFCNFGVFDLQTGEKLWAGGGVSVDEMQAVLVSNDGQRVLAMSHFRTGEWFAVIQFFYPRGLKNTIVYKKLSPTSRRFYPGEPRYLEKPGARVWVSGIDFDGRFLNLKTTGLFNFRIDAETFSVVGRTLNGFTVVRWGVYSLVGLFASVVVLSFTTQKAARLIQFVVSKKRARKLAMSLCPNCSYSLRGLPEARCPECGEDFDMAGRERAVDLTKGRG